MSHHSDDEPFIDPDRVDAIRKKLVNAQSEDEAPEVFKARLRRQLLDTTGFRGAVGSFPDGQLGPNDEGSLQFGLSAVDGRVVIDFGKPVRSLGMTPQEACDFAGDLVKLARAAARKNGETVALTLR